MQSYNFQQLILNITSHSENANFILYSDDEDIYFSRLLKNWKKTSSEWALFDVEENETDICECGKTIHNLYTILNKRNGKKLIVGSHCIKHFENKELNENVKKIKQVSNSYKKLVKNQKIRLKMKFIKKCCDKHKYVYQILENHNELIKLIKKYNSIDNIIEKNNKFYFRTWKIEPKKKTITCILVNNTARFLF